MSHTLALRPSLSTLARRVGAYLVDGALLFAGVVLTQALLYATGLHPFRAEIEAGLWPGGWRLHLWVFLSTSLPFWVYYATLHSSPWQATLGKRLLRLRVVTVSGGRLGLGRALLRAVVMLIPFEVNHLVILRLAPVDGSAPGGDFYLGLALVYGLLALYLAVMLLNPQRRGVHDLIAGSRVLPPA
jgi:uncharacterized RDD family membrane protein YckC